MKWIWEGPLHRDRDGGGHTRATATAAIMVAGSLPDPSQEFQRFSNFPGSGRICVVDLRGATAP